VARTKNEVTLDRRESVDRRGSEDRRTANIAVAEERRQAPRRKTPRRRQIDPTTCERDYSDQEIEFMQAMDAYKRSSGRMFPTCSEILEVLRDLGYQQVGKAEGEPQAAEPGIDVKLTWSWLESWKTQKKTEFRFISCKKQGELRLAFFRRTAAACGVLGRMIILRFRKA